MLKKFPSPILGTLSNFGFGDFLRKTYFQTLDESSLVFSMCGPFSCLSEYHYFGCSPVRVMEMLEA